MRPEIRGGRWHLGLAPHVAQGPGRAADATGAAALIAGGLVAVAVAIAAALLGAGSINGDEREQRGNDNGRAR